MIVASLTLDACMLLFNSSVSTEVVIEMDLISTETKRQ